MVTKLQPEQHIGTERHLSEWCLCQFRMPPRCRPLDRYDGYLGQFNRSRFPLKILRAALDSIAEHGSKRVTSKPIIYFAAPLFTQGEWHWNAQVVTHLRDHGFEVVVPQERATPMLCGAEEFDAALLFHENVRGIERAGAVLAILDGADADSGVCWECGYASHLRRPVIGLRTDIRKSGDDPRGVNLMLSECCSDLIVVPAAEREQLRWLEKIVEAIGRGIRQEGLLN
jgi:nucleoside 2-deoxyribosyltransferase